MRAAYRRRYENRREPEPSFGEPISQACTHRQFTDPAFRRWVEEYGQPFSLHRKLWEWCFIGQVLELGDCLRPGRRGIAFGVGSEPLAPAFARRGAEVLATDLPPDHAAAETWSATGQHANAHRFDEIDGVTFRSLDMTDLPADLRDFDFSWSSCVVEHLGSIDATTGFLVEHLRCLVPGGLAVHTTEFNVSSDDETVESGDTILMRKRDICALRDRLERDGHTMDVTFRLGNEHADRFVDRPPYAQETHLKLELEGFIATSFGLVIRKARA